MARVKGTEAARAAGGVVPATQRDIRAARQALGSNRARALPGSPRFSGPSAGSSPSLLPVPREWRGVMAGQSPWRAPSRAPLASAALAGLPPSSTMEAKQPLLSSCQTHSLSLALLSVFPKTQSSFLSPGGKQAFLLPGEARRTRPLLKNGSGLPHGGPSAHAAPTPPGTLGHRHTPGKAAGHETHSSQ